MSGLYFLYIFFVTIHMFHPFCRFRWSSDGLQHSLDVSTLYHDLLQLLDQRWPIHYSIDSVNQHITRRCNIQHDDLSVASSSRFIAVLHALPDSLILISSFQNNCTGNVFEWWETNTASGLRLVCTMVGKTNFLSRSILSSSHFPF